MLKIVQPITNTHNLKCGEIFCISPAVYNVTCCLCATKMHFEQFPSHFQFQHLSLVEESINLATDANLMDNIAIKYEDPEDDPIKQEEAANEEDKSIQQLIREFENVAGLQQNTNNESFENGDKDLIVEEKPRKSSKRNTKKLRTKSTSFIQQDDELDLLTTKKEQEDNTFEDNEIVCSKLEEEQHEYEENDDDMDKDWSMDSDNGNASYSALQFPCLLCKRSYRFKSSLKRHTKKAHNSEGLSTNPKKSIKNTKDNQSVSKELEPDQNTSEDDDDNDRDKDWSLDDSQKYLKADSDNGKNTLNNKLQFPCLVCKRSYRLKSSLKRHLKKAHNSEAPLANPKETIKNTKENEDVSNELEKDHEDVSNELEKDHNEHEDGDEDDDSGMEKGWWLEYTQEYTKKDSGKNKKPNDGSRFPCLICKQTYRFKNSLKRHMQKNHNPEGRPTKPKEHKCEECSEIFPSDRELRRHRWTHKSLVCDVCDRTFANTSSLSNHKVRHTGIKAHKCNECDKDFFTSKELKAHLVCHTGFMPHICEICGKRCRNRGVLKAHMRRHTGERPAKCEVCGKCFFSFHDRNLHAITHTTERPFKCDICGSTFQRKKALRLHKLIHSKDRKHVCKVCGKGFALSSGLSSHMRSHDTAIEKSTMESAILSTTAVENQNTLVFITTANSTTVSMAQESNNRNIIGQYMV